MVLLSLLIAIAASGIGLQVAGHETPRTSRLVLTGPVMGLAIAGTHYMGMASLRLPASQHYDRLLVAAGASVDAPKTAGVNQTYKQAPRQLRKAAEPLGLFDPHAPLDPTTRRRKRASSATNTRDMPPPPSSRSMV